MKKVKLKDNSKKNKSFKFFKVLFLIALIFISSVITIKYLIKNNINITDEEYVNYLLSESYKNGNSNFIIRESIKLLTDIDLTSPSSMLDSKIKNVKENDSEYEKDAVSKEDNYDSSVYEKLTSYVSNPLEEVSNPIVYLYNTHQLETYSNSGLENTSITPNVMMTSYLLAEKLNKLGISTIVEDTNVSEFIRISNLESDAFYSATRVLLKDTMSNKPTIKYFIDLHRDSVSKDISTCTINGKSYARILFVLGASNANVDTNKKVMNDIDKIADELYPGLSRGIYEKSTPDWPLVYNQDLSSGVFLIEVGAKDNTLDEIVNTTEALSNILKKYIKGE